jgi:uncharacterized protein YjiS (DUF1127 family)
MSIPQSLLKNSRLQMAAMIHIWERESLYARLVQMRSSHMTVLPFGTPHGGAARVASQLRSGRVARSALAALREWRKRVRNRKELMALDERTLHDLGLSRGDIPYLSSRAAERDSWSRSLHFPPF